MSGLQRGGGRGRGAFPQSGPIAQRGGRGRGGGDPSQDQGESSQTSTGPHPVVYGNGTFPLPSEEIHNVEERYLQDYAGKKEELDNGRGDVMMPYRPNYGSEGEEVVLWANYFHLRFQQPGVIHKYNFSIYDPRKASKNEEATKDKKNDGKVTGRKAMDIFQVIIQRLRRDNPGALLATDFKQKIVTAAPFNSLPATVMYPVPQGVGSHEYVLEFSHQSLDVRNLVHFLNDQAQTPRPLSDTDADSNANRFPFHQDIIDAIGTITGHTARENTRNIVTVGRSRYFSKTKDNLRKMLGNPNILQILKGFSQSVRPATGRLLLNVSVTHGVFRCPGSISALLGKLGGYNRDSLRKLDKIISRARVQYRVPAKQQPPWKHVTIAGLARNTDKCGGQSKDPRFKNGKVPGFVDASEVEFYLNKPPKNVVPARPAPGLEWNTYCTVSEYYWKKHNYRAQPTLPVVNVGRPTDPVYVPAECCELVGFDPIRYELEGDQSSKMIEFEVKRPPQNAKFITKDGLSNVFQLNSSNTLLRGLRVTVEPEPISVKGRQLKSPELLYSAKLGVNDKVKRTIEGAGWNLKPEQEGLSFFEPGRTIQKWTWFIFTPDLGSRNRIGSLMEGFQKYLSELGIKFLNEATPSDGLLIPYQAEDSMEAVKDSIETAVGGRDLDFALVILPSNRADVYTAVKIVGDMWLGFHTVCVISEKFLEFDRSQWANLAAKINLKFGGTNHAIFGACEPFHLYPTMLVGYDVVHPPGQAGNLEELKSQVGLVASASKWLGQWHSCHWTQPANQEVIDDQELTRNFESLLRLFKTRLNVLPKNILIYRDGVSEGQYLQVLDKELPRIRKACDNIYGETDAKPKISLIVSVKRHATRFFPTDEANTDKSKNIKNGTVVDRGVTQARCWDFYLKSHTALKGTARPAHYVVLHDEIFVPYHLRDVPTPVSASDALAAGKESVHTLETYTHQLCYIFGRSTKAISICTPARYADIVCTRARLYASALARLASRPGLSKEERDTILAKSVHEKLEHSMYWI